MSTVVSNKRKGKSGLANRFFSARTIPMLATLFVCVLLYVIACATKPAFGSASVFLNIFVDNAPLGIVAVGMTLVIVSGGIDLSVAGVVALCTVVIAKLMGTGTMHPVTCWMVALLIGTGMGFLTGCVIRYFKIEPFIATLAGLFLARGIAIMISESALPISHPFMDKLTTMGLPIYLGFPAGEYWVGLRYDPLWISLPALVLFAVVGIALYITFFTSFGRNLFAVGANEDAAHLMGLPVGRTKLQVYMLSGFLAALAAIVFTINLPQGDPIGADGWELNAIAASVIGGTLMTGGAGNVFGTLIGVTILGIIMSGMDFHNVSSYYSKILIGVLLLVFVVLQRFLSGKRAE